MKTLVLLSDVFTRYDPSVLHPFSINDLWDHSLEVAALAGAIAQTTGDREQSADARLIGLLHDIGRLGLLVQVHCENAPLIDALVAETADNLRFHHAKSDQEKVRTHTSFRYQASSWTHPRKVVARLEC